MLARVALSPGSETTIDVRDGALWRLSNGAPAELAGQPDTRDAVRRALAEPVGFPPLTRAVVPGDAVAAPLGEGVPELEAVAAGVVDVLTAAGVEPGSVALVTAAERDAAALEAALGGLLPADVAVVRHDPADEQQLCFAGMTRDDEPLLINRTLFEADVTLPITCARGAADLDARGAFSGIYPALSDVTRLRQFRRDAPRHPSRWRDLTEEAGWLVGAPMVLRVVPGPRGAVASAVAGAPESVDQATDDACRRLWTRRAESRAKLVIATVAGEARRQSWTDVARALATAERLVAPGGAVAVCTQLDAPLGKSLSRLVGAVDLEAVDRRLERDEAPDTWAAREIARSLMRGPVFFMSNLRAELVEDMGMAPVAGGEELGRLASRYESCLLVEDSQHVMVTTDEAEAV